MEILMYYNHPFVDIAAGGTWKSGWLALKCKSERPSMMILQLQLQLQL